MSHTNHPQNQFQGLGQNQNPHQLNNGTSIVSENGYPESVVKNSHENIQDNLQDNLQDNFQDKQQNNEEESRFKDGELLNLIRVRFPGNAKSFPFLVGK